MCCVRIHFTGLTACGACAVDSAFINATLGSFTVKLVPDSVPGLAVTLLSFVSPATWPLADVDGSESLY